jgi:tetratricopeptide (TPR) repeat protein
MTNWPGARLWSGRTGRGFAVAAIMGATLLAPVSAASANSSKIAKAYKWNRAGLSYLQRGDLSKAQEYIEKALNAGKELDSQRLTAAATSSLAALQWAKGDLTRAEQTYKQALIMERKRGDARAIARTLTNLAVVYFEQANYVLAEALLHKALGHYIRLDERMRMSRCYAKLGETLRLRGNLKRAEAAYRKAVRIDMEEGAHKVKAEHLAELREVRLLRQAVKEDRQLVAPGGGRDWKQLSVALADRYNGLASSFRKNGKLEEAEAAYRQALTINKALGRKEELIKEYSGLGIVYKTQGEIARAVDMHTKALGLAQETGAKDALARVHANLGTSLNYKGDKTRACAHWDKARELFRETGASPEMSRAEALMKEIGCTGA